MWIWRRLKALLGQLYVGQALRCFIVNDFTSACGYYRRAISLLKHVGDDVTLGKAHTGLGHSLWRQNEIEDACEEYLAAEQFVEIGSERLALLSRLGTCLQRVGRRQEALTIWHKGLVEARKCGRPDEVIHALSMLCWGHHITGAPPETQESVYREMLTVVDGLRSWDAAWTYNVLLDIVVRASEQRDIQTLRTWRNRLARPFPILIPSPLGRPVISSFQIVYEGHSGELLQMMNDSIARLQGG